MHKALILVFALAGFLAGQAAAEYTIEWYTIDGGGGDTSSSRYTINATVGQPDTGISSNGSYVLSGGFWPGNFGCIVNMTDLAIFLEQWMLSGWGYSADFDDSGKVDVVDFAELSYWWYSSCPADWPLK